MGQDPPSPRLALLRITGNVLLARCIGIAAELGLADLMPRPSAELAAATSTNAGALYRMLRYLAANGIFAEDDAGSFSNTPMSEFLRTDARGSLRDAVRLGWQDVVWETFKHLPHAVRTGEPAFNQAFGADFFDHLAAHPQLGARFDAAMALESGPENAAIASAYPFGQSRLVVDVGGGRGGLLAEILNRHPALRGILFDQAHVIAQPNQASATGRCDLAAGSFFEDVPAGGDVYVLKRILHDWDDDAAIRILRTCARALRGPARVVVVDAVIRPGNDPDPNKALDVGMLAMLRGRERTADDFARIFTAAGLRLTQILPTPPPSTLSLIEGARPAEA